MKRFDLLIFGATGFTGQFVVETLARTLAKEKLPLKWAIAGRSMQNMKQCLHNASSFTGLNLDHIPMLEANVENAHSMNKVFKESTLVVNCIGPYSLLGEPVVKSCIESDAHYMDLSGEPLFLEKMQLKYDQAARDKRLSIVGSCGFDSIPSDLGTSFLKDQFHGHLNQVEHYLQLWNYNKHFNFATWRALVEGYKCRDQLKSLRKTMFSQFYKQYNWSVPLKRRTLTRNQFGYCVPFPGSDRSVVARTQLYRYTHLDEIPTQFEAYCCIPNLTLLLKLVMLNYNLQMFSRLPKGEEFLLNNSQFFSLGIFDKNEKPIRANLEQNRFRVTLIGKGWSKEETRRSEDNMKLCSAVTISGGDVAYLDTSVMAVQTALILLNKINNNLIRHGVVTPSSVIESKEIVPKLNQQGIQFEFIPEYKI